MPTISTATEVLPNDSAALRRFDGLISSAGTTLPGSESLGALPVGDQAQLFIERRPPMLTERVLIRVANSIHQVSVAGYQSQVTPDYFSYVFLRQLMHVIGPAAVSSAPKQPEDPRHALGYVAAFPNGWRVSVVSVAEQAPTRFAQPSIGNRFVTATVMAFNGASSGEEKVEFVDFQIVGSSRVLKIASTYTGMLGGASKTLAPGASATTTVTFEVPVNESNFTVIYSAWSPRAPEGYPGVAWIGY